MFRRRLAYLEKTIQSLRAATRDTTQGYQSLLRTEIDRLREHPRFGDPKHLLPHGGKIYSQCDEDGIIAEIFRRIGLTNRRFVEFGIGTGLENNTFKLLFEGWSGLWIEASSKSVATIKAELYSVIKAGRLKIVESFITKDNIESLIAANVERGEIDLLSVDIDGNDYHVLRAIKTVTPRVIVIEYNAKFAPPIEFCMEYNESHMWSGDDCFGASLSFLEKNLRSMGYTLVGCNVAGTNAFFVRDELVCDKFMQPYTAEFHYQPARYNLADVPSGHPASFAALTKAVQGERS